MALAVTIGSTVVFDVMLTPMIISAGPILVGLGVDYALHIVNRIEESRRRILDEIHERNYKSRQLGKSEEILPDSWDSIYSGSRNGNNGNHWKSSFIIGNNYNDWFWSTNN